MASFTTKYRHSDVGSRLLTALAMRCRGSGVARTTRSPHILMLECQYGKLHQPTARWLTSPSAAVSDYLQATSSMPTMHFQPAIPQLPVPSLTDTCRRYLASQQPLLQPEEFAVTRSLVEEFEKGAGHELNEELMKLNKKNSHTSYITDAWMDVYLAYRDSVILNSSVVSFVRDDHRPAFMEQTIRATNVMVSSLRFMKTLRDDRLVPDVVYRDKDVPDVEEFWRSLGSSSSQEAYRRAVSRNVRPLDMSQFSRIFNATRIPRHKRDELFCDESQRHVLVLAKGHMYVFDVLDSNGSILPGPAIHANLRYILEHSSSLASPTHPVGYLTTDHRDTWMRLREKLSAECKGNEDSLRLIDSALFCVCLEEDTDDEPERLVGRGLYGNAGNRWFDKPFQLVFTRDGQLLVNMEHSWGDGITMRRLLSETYQDVMECPAVSPDVVATGRIDSSQCVKKLDFKLGPAVCRGIEEAKANHALATSQLSVQCMEYKKYGNSFIKKSRTSPDAVAQLALQMAFHSVTGRVAATYESCSTALFKHGRTETIRSATAETKRCTEAFQENSGVGVEEKRALVRACSDKHRQLTQEATMGQGWDRHLFALRVLASGSGKPLPGIFQDPAYANINTIALSTSTMGQLRASTGAAFAPVSPAGLGVAYFVEEEGVQWIATGYPTSPSLSDFGRSLHEAYDKLHEVLSI